MCKNDVLGIHSDTFLDKIWTWEGAWRDPGDLPGAPVVSDPQNHQNDNFLGTHFGSLLTLMSDKKHKYV